MKGGYKSLPDCWDLPPDPLLLPDHEVHAWRADLGQSPARIEEFLRTLTDDERDRAARFYFQKDRDHFIVARGVLKSILARYLGVGPAQLRFCYSRYGKPSLASGLKADWLRFNVSHSQGLALYAVARGREVGIDLERIRPGFADEQIAERFFSDEEVRALRALSEDMQDEAFFNCWTRKEAYIKAKGEGLSVPLDQFSVTLAPGESAALLHASGDTLEASRWSLRELMPGVGFKGAVAVEGGGWQLKCWQWDKHKRSHSASPLSDQR